VLIILANFVPLRQMLDWGPEIDLIRARQPGMTCAGPRLQRV